TDVIGDASDRRVAFGDGAFVVLPEQFIDDWHGEDREQARQRLRSVVEAGLGRAPSVRTDAPMLLWTNPWLCAEGRVLAVHLTNYDVDLNADTLEPAEDFVVDVRLPRRLNPDRATLVRPGEEPLELAVRVANGRARVEVPRVDQYAVLAIYRGEALEAACALAQGKRALERIHVASLGREVRTSDLAGLEQRARGLLAAGRSEEALDAAMTLHEEAGSRLEQVIDENLSQERAERQARLASDAPHRFDFGEEAAAEGWTEVRADTVWSEQQGYGWLSAPDAAAHGGGEPDALHGDTLRGTEPATFAVRLPEGRYEVTLIEGDPGSYYRCSVTHVDVGGVSKLLGTQHWGGVFSTRTFLADVDEGRLEMTLDGDAVGPCYRNGTGWQLAGMTIRPVEAQPSAEAWVRRCNSALRDWAVVGTFDDDSCEALDLVYPPERDPSAGATYREGTERLSWQHYLAPEGGMAPVPLAALFDQIDGAVAYAMTHLHVPSARKARLLVGTTGRGQVWLNGEQVLRDEVTDGLRADEFIVPVRLRAGWNRLLVKVANNWHEAFACSACVMGADGRPFEDLRCSATGAQEVELPPALALGTPMIESEAEALELGGEMAATVSFTNSADRPLSGDIALRLLRGVTGSEAVVIEPERRHFEGLQPGETATARFMLRGVELSPWETADLAATVTVGDRARTQRWGLPYRQPRLEVIPVTAHHPRELQAASMDDVAGWRFAPDRPLEGRVELETEDVKEGEGGARVTITANGDGTEDYPQLEPEEVPGLTNWSSYDRLSLWAKVTDENPSVQSRPIAVVVYDREMTQHSLRADVPAGEWQRLEWDISGLPRWDVPQISIYLYEHQPDLETTFTWLLDDMRLTRTEAAAPPSPRSIPVILAVTNPLSEPVEGSVTVTPPEGWEVEAAGSLTVPPERSRAAHLYLTPPADAQGDYALAASFATEGYVLRGEASVLVRPQVVVPRTEEPPKLDGRLDDAAWEGAARLSGFVLNEDCRPAPTPTEVLLTWDERALYVAYGCAEPQMDELVAEVTETDGHVWEDDCLEFYLDADGVPGGHDHYLVNALGTIRVERGGHPGWGRHTRAASQVGEEEWTAEVMVPFADYESAPQPGDRWLANFNRTRQGKPGSPTEYQCWSCTHGSFERPERFGQLIFGDGQ
ncbi:MAG: sugar-binding protein, partial [Armatimonadota bacterium]|nr:sugar-binding protein [Armatimonadota bacterium]